VLKVFFITGLLNLIFIFKKAICVPKIFRIDNYLILIQNTNIINKKISFDYFFYYRRRLAMHFLHSNIFMANKSKMNKF